ncbi:MAG: ATP-binding cassette domain-containing protein [Streptosporangiales bacterium]|nr:ATP-binding cassette domain-containing protein [Streptosporangiales bacterium]
MTNVIETHDLTKVYGAGDTAVHALRGVTLRIGSGEYVAVMGASGSGKSTLMHLLGCLDVPSAGRYLLDGTDVAELDAHTLGVVRNRRIGFVFQAFNLVPRMTALDNVALPLVYARVRTRRRRTRAQEALASVGLDDRGGHRPNELSGGQQQRVAIARALVNDPALILADEPTGNLDSDSSAEVLAMLDRLNGAGRTVVVITHESEVAQHARRVVSLRDGRVVDDAPTVRLAAAGGAR